MARLEADRREEGGAGLQVRELVLLVLVERHDAEVVLRGEPRDVGHPHGGVVLGDEAAEGVAELLEQLTVALEQRLREKDVVVAEERLVHLREVVESVALQGVRRGGG